MGTSGLAADIAKEAKMQERKVEEATVDLQKELEKKFDELFGSSNDDSVQE